MGLDVYKMTKQEILERQRFKCPLPGHGSHDGFSHASCFAKHAKGLFQEKILFFDIEAEDLNADYGIMFNWYAIDEDGNHFEDFITLNDIKKYKSSDRNVEPKEDTRIVKSLVELMSKYTRVCGHYSCGYDLPFARTRAVIDKIDFPAYGMLFQSDSWVILKKKFKLSRNSLENGCRKLVGVTHKDKLSLSIKYGCLRGEKWAMDLSRLHCKQDVIDQKALFELITGYMRKTKSSI
jgi:hypothetical protein